MAKSAPKKASAPKKTAPPPPKAAGAKASAPAPAAKASTSKTPAKAAPAKAAPAKAPAPRAAPAPSKAQATKAKAPATATKAPGAPVKAPAKPVAEAPAKAAAAKTVASKAPAKAPAATEAPAKATKSAAPAAPPKPAKSAFDAKFLDAQRELLREERAKLLGQADHLDAEAAALMEDLDPGDVQFDDESGEGDTLVVERERDLALAGQARQTVAEIDAALARIADGTYGLSVISGRPIPKERLRAIPWATELVEEKVGGLGTRR